MEFTTKEFISDKSTNGLLVWLENAACFLSDVDTVHLQAHVHTLCERYDCSIDSLHAYAAMELYAEASEDTCDPEYAAETAYRLSEGVRACQQELLRRVGLRDSDRPTAGGAA